MGAGILRSSTTGWLAHAVMCGCAVVVTFACLLAPSLGEAQSATLVVSPPPRPDQPDAMELDHTLAQAGGTGGCPTGYVRIAPGRFTMGAPAMDGANSDGTHNTDGTCEFEDTQRRVTITRAYCIKVTEVTQGEWQSLMGSNPSSSRNCGADCPVEVSWNNAITYANALSRRDGREECYKGSRMKGLACTGYRLPTEAEWEYAARPMSSNVVYGNLGTTAWYDENSGDTSHPVGLKLPNGWGLYDMLGNVWEWTGDRYAESRAAVTDPVGPSRGATRVFRGGGWMSVFCGPWLSSRAASPPEARNSVVGFRVVMTAPSVSSSPEGERGGASLAAKTDATSSCSNGYVRVAPGQFTMGSPLSEWGRENDENVHQVTIARPFCLQASEVTQGEWEAVMGNNPSGFRNCGSDCPVEAVSWDDAVRYANELSWREGLPECYRGGVIKEPICNGYRLPTEAEWEYAARAGSETATYLGDLSFRGARNAPGLDAIAWYGGNSGVQYDLAYNCSGWDDMQSPARRCGPHPVRQKQPNAWGLYDMLGNVSEWVGDAYVNDGGRPTKAAPGAPDRVSRGGSWGSDVWYVRAANRRGDPPTLRSLNTGFRLARTLQ
jgi:formylglycine-generating enzyme required for sulfatase activity